MKLQLNNFNNRHLEETIYIIGCAPHINDLSSAQLDSLKENVVIGVNLAIEKIKNVDYMITGHIETAAYLLEYGPPRVPIFAHYNDHKEYAREVWDNKRIVEVRDLSPRIPLAASADEKNELYGNTSILLTATHLAYIMGAKKIIYVGFEEASALHYFNVDKKIEKRILSNIKKILESKKYWSPVGYSTDWNGIATKRNIHSALEAQLGLIKNAPTNQSNFNRSVEELKQTSFSGPAYEPGYSPNLKNFKSYVEFLNQNNVKTLTIAKSGITNAAGCIKTDT